MSALQYPTSLALDTYVLSITNGPTGGQKPNVMKVVATDNGSTPVCLQLHATSTAPANNAVPIATVSLVPAYAGGVSMATLDYLDLGQRIAGSGVTAILSTSFDRLTAATSEKGSIAVSLEEQNLEQDAATTTVGDLTTGVHLLQVWAEASAPHKLLRAQAINNTGADAWLVAFAVDIPLTTSLPVVISPKLTAGAPLNWYFGDFSGLSPLQQDVSTNTLHQGCTLQFATSLSPLTLGAGTGFVIRATYL